MLPVLYRQIVTQLCLCNAGHWEMAQPCMGSQGRRGDLRGCYGGYTRSPRLKLTGRSGASAIIGEPGTKHN